VIREFSIDRRGGAVHVLLIGDIDEAAVPAVSRSIHRAVLMPTSRIVVDLGGVTFLDAAGLGAIVDGYHTATAVGIGFTIAPSDIPVVRRILAVTGIDEALRAEPAFRDEWGAAG